MEKIPSYKKKLFIGTKIQRDLIIYIIGMCLISQLLVISHDMSNDALNSDPYMPYIIILVNIIFYGYLLFGLWLTNRIAGPLFRLEKHMHEVAEGRMESDLQFRKNDYGAGIAEAFNEVIKQRVSKP